MRWFCLLPFPHSFSKAFSLRESWVTSVLTWSQSLGTRITPKVMSSACRAVISRKEQQQQLPQFCNTNTPQACKALVAKLNLTSFLRLTEHHGSFSNRVSPGTRGRCLLWVGGVTSSTAARQMVIELRDPRMESNRHGELRVLTQEPREAGNSSLTLSSAPGPRSHCIISDLRSSAKVRRIQSPS